MQPSRRTVEPGAAASTSAWRDPEQVRPAGAGGWLAGPWLAGGWLAGGWLAGVSDPPGDGEAAITVEPLSRPPTGVTSVPTKAATAAAATAAAAREDCRVMAKRGRFDRVGKGLRKVLGLGFYSPFAMVSDSPLRPVTTRSSCP